MQTVDGFMKSNRGMMYDLYMDTVPSGYRYSNSRQLKIDTEYYSQSHLFHEEEEENV